MAMAGPAQAGQRRGPWSQFEDDLLMTLIQNHGCSNWVRISQELGSRSAKQCRERYHQNLNPSLNHEPITKEEGQLINYLVDTKGKRWAEIARQLHGRCDNSVKNWWNGSQNKRRRQNRRLAGNSTTCHEVSPYAQKSLPDMSPVDSTGFTQLARPSLPTTTLGLPAPVMRLPGSSPNTQPGIIYQHPSDRSYQAVHLTEPALPSPKSAYSDGDEEQNYTTSAHTLLPPIRSWPSQSSDASPRQFSFGQNGHIYPPRQLITAPSSPMFNGSPQQQTHRPQSGHSQEQRTQTKDSRMDVSSLLW